LWAERSRVVIRATVCIALAVLAGCTSPSTPPATSGPLYTHEWHWGPSNYPGASDPLFHDTFPLPASARSLLANATWNVAHGSAAVILTSPDGAATNLSAPASGIGGNSMETSSSPQGTWDFRIPTWRAQDGAFPEGRVHVEVWTARLVANG